MALLVEHVINAKMGTGIILIAYPVTVNHSTFTQMELRVIKTLYGSTSSAAAVTDTMLGLMDMQIDTKTSSAAITDVYFDEPGGVSVTGNLKRKRAHLKHNSNGYSPYRMQVASRAKKSLEQVARLVVASDKK